MEAVEAAKVHVGDEQVVALGAYELLGRLVGRDRGDVIAAVAQQFCNPVEGVFVVVQSKNPIGQFHIRWSCVRRQGKGDAGNAVADQA
jgi:hypothetical protein